MAGFARERRRDVWLLSDAYYRGRYGQVDYTAEEAARCIEAAEALMRLVEGVRGTLGEA